MTLPISDRTMTVVFIFSTIASIVVYDLYQIFKPNGVPITHVLWEWDMAYGWLKWVVLAFMAWLWWHFFG